MRSRTIYPEIDIRESGQYLTITTSLRKEHNGKWYFWDFLESIIYTDMGKRHERREKLIQKIHTEVYSVIILGVIDLNFTHVIGREPVFEEDIEQHSESKRLKQLYYVDTTRK